MKNLKTILLTISGCFIFAIVMGSYVFMMNRIVQLSNDQQKIVQVVVKNSDAITNHATLINKYHSTSQDFQKLIPKKETKKVKK